MLSFIVVTYDSEIFIRRCLESIIANVHNIDYEIIVQDNNSKDLTPKIVNELQAIHHGIKLINSNVNNGYAGGNDEAAKYARGDLLFILNPDTILEKYSHEKVLSLLKSDDKISVIQPKIKKMDNQAIVESTGHFIDILGNAYIENKDARNKEFPTKRIFAALGAGFIIKKEVFDKLGGFDEDFFLLYEETDLCWRNNLLGYKVYYLDDIEIIHFGGASLNAGHKRGESINYKMTYLYLRNKIISGIKNIIEPELLILFLSGNILLYILSSFFWLLRFNFRYFAVIWMALFSIVFSFPLIRKKRKLNRDIIIFGNRQLLDLNLITKFDFIKWFNKVY